MTNQELADDALLYHYTSGPGLLGILQTNNIWASDAQFLNDASELRYGKKELADELVRESERLDDHVAASALSSRASVLSLVADMLLPDDDVMDRAVVSGAYVACFCEDGDLLSQWRGYAGADGYALGFRPDHLVEWEHDVLGPVQYGAEAVSALVAEIVPDTARASANHPTPTAVAVIENTVLRRLARIKDESFAEEREWRLIAVRDPTDDELRFRAGAFGIVPYFSLAFPAEALACVVVGPGNHARLRARGVRRALEHVFRDMIPTSPTRGGGAHLSNPISNLTRSTEVREPLLSARDRVAVSQRHHRATHLAGDYLVDCRLPPRPDQEACIVAATENVEGRTNRRY